MLVNNLGWYLMERLPNITIEQWEQALTLNCMVAFFISPATHQFWKSRLAAGPHH